MTYIFTALLVIVVIGLILWIFVNSDASTIAITMRLAIPVTLIVIGTIATISGRGNIGIPAAVLGLYWLYTQKKKL